MCWFETRCRRSGTSALAHHGASAARRFYTPSAKSGASLLPSPLPLLALLALLAALSLAALPTVGRLFGDTAHIRQTALFGLICTPAGLRQGRWPGPNLAGRRWRLVRLVSKVRLTMAASRQAAMTWIATIARCWRRWPVARRRRRWSCRRPRRGARRPGGVRRRGCARLIPAVWDRAARRIGSAE